MKEFLATLTSNAPYCQSRNYAMEVPKEPKEGHDEYEKRTWRHRSHIDADGQIIIPAEALQFAIRDGAAYLSERIPGKGVEKWTKHFASGVMVPRPIVLPERRETMQGTWVHVHANGRRGSGTRVWRCFPTVPKWQGDITIIVLDDLITEEILRRVVQHAGLFIGVGQNKPQNGGSRGRFVLSELIEIKDGLAEAA